MVTATESTKDKEQAKKSHFNVSVRDDYVHLVTKGPLDVNNLDAPANAALALAKEKKLDKLLDDIRYVDSSGVNISIQSKGFGVLWKLREFKKVAIIFKEKELGHLFFSTLEAIHINSKFGGFDNEAEAIAWLKDDSK
jgi:hypothetical protein